MGYQEFGQQKLYFERKGDGEKLLFIPGTASDLRQKRQIFESPLASKFDLLSYDQRGIGQYTFVEANLTKRRPSKINSRY